MITNIELAKKSLSLLKLNTVYASGMLLTPITAKTIAAKAAQFPNLYPQTKQKILKGLIGKDYYGTDCVCMVKALVRGFPEVQDAVLCPDYTTEEMIEDCTDVSTDFSSVVLGEIVWIEGHIGLVAEIKEGTPYTVECTTNIYNKVVKKPLSARKWTKHGKLSKYVKYGASDTYDSVQFTKELKTLFKLPESATTQQILEKTPELKYTQPAISNDIVKAIQKRLINLNYSLGTGGITGRYDKAMVATVKLYQKNNTANGNYDLIDGVMSAKGRMWKHMLGLM